MIITNNQNIPKALYDAIVSSANSYTKQQSLDPEITAFSATELLKAPYQRLLYNKHSDQITTDASNLLAQYDGNIWHADIARYGGADSEVKASRMLEVDGFKYLITGTIDYLLPKTIIDWKRCKSYKTKDGIPNEWMAQLNIYKWILGERGKEIEALYCYAMYKDFGGSSGLTNPTEYIESPIWSDESTENFISKRILYHNKFEIQFPYGECSPVEREESEPKYAVMKDGGVRASKVCDDENEARDIVAQKGPGYMVVIRLGERKSCANNWCMVNQFCSSWKEYSGSYGSQE